MSKTQTSKVSKEDLDSLEALIESCIVSVQGDSEAEVAHREKYERIKSWVVEKRGSKPAAKKAAKKAASKKVEKPAEEPEKPEAPSDEDGADDLI